MDLDTTKLLESFMHLGEIQAQMRELIHDKRGESQRNDAVARTMAKLEDVPAKIDRMEQRLDQRMEKIEGRLSTLETDNSNRKVVNNVWTRFLESPVLGWFMGAVGTIIAIAIYFLRNQNG